MASEEKREYQTGWIPSAICASNKSNTEMHFLIISRENTILSNQKSVLSGYSLPDSLELEFLEKRSVNVLQKTSKVL